MMDQQCISSIMEVISESNMADLDFYNTKLRPITCETDDNGKEIHTVHHEYFVSMCNKLPLSEAWVAGNLLLFTVFDGYLENTYRLVEGAAFRGHYNNLPESTPMELIEKNCYRILKIIRNGIQHSLSNVHYNSGGYNISYCYNNTVYSLQISKSGIRNLYTLIMNIIKGQIMGIYGKYRTFGHYDGIMHTLYADMEREITQISDDIGTNLLIVPNGLMLRDSARYPVENPRILAEDNTSIVFRHIENNGTDDENSEEYYYSTDYIYKDYLLPQEIGVITKGNGNSFQERIKNSTIRFEKNCIEDKWKLKL